jgi:D-lactate dehydrogenase (cytochrome)
LYTTTTAKSTGSLAFAIIATGASVVLNALVLFRSRETDSSNAIPEAVLDVPTAPEPTCNLVKALEELQAEFPESSVVSTDPDELYAYAQSVYSQFVGQFVLFMLYKQPGPLWDLLRRIATFDCCSRTQH